MTNTAYAAALRKIADLYESDSELIQPYPSMYIFAHEREEFLKAVARMAKGGKISKKVDAADHSYPYFHATRDFGGVTIDIQIPRNTVCRKIQDAIYECPESLLEEAKEYTEEPLL